MDLCLRDLFAVSVCFSNEPVRKSKYLGRRLRFESLSCFSSFVQKNELKKKPKTNPAVLVKTASLLYFLWWTKKMCKTSSKVLNINFSESQPGVKGRKPRVSVPLTIRRWAVTSSSPPSFRDSAPPLADPRGRSSAPRLQPEKWKRWKERRVPGRLGRGGGSAPEASAGCRRCSPWWRRSTIQEEAVCSRLTGSVRPLRDCARVRALRRLLPSHAPVLPLQPLSQDCGGRSPSSLANTPSCLLSSRPLVTHGGWVWEECSGVTQEFEITWDEAEED